MSSTTRRVGIFQRTVNSNGVASASYQSNGDSSDSKKKNSKSLPKESRRNTNLVPGASMFKNALGGIMKEKNKHEKDQVSNLTEDVGTSTKLANENEAKIKKSTTDTRESRPEHSEIFPPKSTAKNTENGEKERDQRVPNRGQSMKQAEPVVEEEPVGRNEEEVKPERRKIIPPTAVTSEPAQNAVKSKRRREEWNQVDLSEMTVKRRSAFELNSSALSASSFNGLTHSMPRKTVRIQSSLDGSTRLAPFFTNAYPFSNHFLCKFTVDDLEFCCTEQFYMYYKAKVFCDEQSAREIMRCTEAKQIKRLGGKIRLFDTAKWRHISILVMVIGNLKKYEQNQMLRKFLFETEDAVLVEASPDDTYWGIGISVNNTAAVRDQKNWQGKNVLGRILTRIRETLKRREEYREEWDQLNRTI